MRRGPLAIATIAAAVITACGTSQSTAPRSHTSPERDGLGRTREVQSGPLPNGEKVTLEDAKARTPYDLPVPPANDTTGELTGIWIDGTQVAFVWTTDLTFYVGKSESGEAAAERGWRQKVEEQPEDGSEMTTARGHVAIGRDGHGDSSPSNLTWIENGLSLQFVASRHTLEQLRELADAIEIEG
ncbi:MAG TPA: hypothetical protein VHN37_09490 [Actinomycetota bacterium]|nr:hypothetical protein [Actinomycetota bacterium]